MFLGALFHAKNYKKADFFDMHHVVHYYPYYVKYDYHWIGEKPFLKKMCIDCVEHNLEFVQKFYGHMQLETGNDMASKYFKEQEGSFYEVEDAFDVINQYLTNVEVDSKEEPTSSDWKECTECDCVLYKKLTLLNRYNASPEHVYMFVCNHARVMDEMKDLFQRAAEDENDQRPTKRLRRIDFFYKFNNVMYTSYNKPKRVAMKTKLGIWNDFVGNFYFSDIK
jgi:hypothetical protein